MSKTTTINTKAATTPKVKNKVPLRPYENKSSWSGTQGRAGMKLPRMNLLFSPSVKEKLKIQSNEAGMTYSEFLTVLVQNYIAEGSVQGDYKYITSEVNPPRTNLAFHPETYNKIKTESKDLKMTYAEFLSMLIINNSKNNNEK